jgi:hypothetical protein
MSIPANLDQFNRFCLAVFGKLYLSFPVPIELDVGELMMSAIPGAAGQEATWDALSSGGHAIEFLAAEGFLVHQGGFLDGSQFMQVRLTMKGLAVLGSVPGSLEKRESLISKILSVIGKGLKDAASEQVSELSSQAFAFALASAPTLAAVILRP